MHGHRYFISWVTYLMESFDIMHPCHSPLFIKIVSNYIKLTFIFLFIDSFSDLIFKNSNPTSITRVVMNGRFFMRVPNKNDNVELFSLNDQVSSIFLLSILKSKGEVVFFADFRI